MENNKSLDKCKNIGHKVKTHVRYVWNCLSIATGMVLVTGGPVTALAKPQGSTQQSTQQSTQSAPDMSFLKGNGNGAFDGLTETVKETGASGMNLAVAVGIVALAIATIMAGVTIAFKKGQKREEGKESLSNIFLGGVIVFGAVGIVSLIAGIASAAFK